jgi:5-methylcytosine-specific restriction protein A
MQRAPRICSCGLKVAYGETCICRKRRNAEADRARPSARQRGYDSKWERESKAFLALPQNRLCACGCGRAADMVDHKIAPKGDMRLFWDRSNWQPMARGCNSRKAVLQEGAFGKHRGVVADFGRAPRDQRGPAKRDTPDFRASGQ